MQLLKQIIRASLVSITFMIMCAVAIISLLFFVWLLFNGLALMFSSVWAAILGVFLIVFIFAFKEVE